MGKSKIWRIKNGEREQIEVDYYDIWKDGYEWKLKLPSSGIETFKTKKLAEYFRKSFKPSW